MSWPGAFALAACWATFWFSAAWSDAERFRAEAAKHTASIATLAAESARLACGVTVKP